MLGMMEGSIREPESGEHKRAQESRWGIIEGIYMEGANTEEESMLTNTSPSPG